MSTTREFFDGDYEYTIVIDPIVPPLSNGISYEAKLNTVLRRRGGNVERLTPEPIGASGTSQDEALQKADKQVRAWIEQLKSN